MMFHFHFQTGPCIGALYSLTQREGHPQKLSGDVIQGRVLKTKISASLSQGWDPNLQQFWNK